MKRGICKFIVFIAVVFVISHVLYAEEFPEPIFPIDKIERKMLIKEYIYWRTIQSYKQPLELEIIRESEAKYDTPENTLIALLSAMKTVDYEWFISIWDKESRDIFIEKEEKDEDIIRKFKDSWEETFSTATFFLIRRVDRKNDVVLEYKAQSPNMPDYGNALFFRKEDGKWKTTNMSPRGVVADYLITGKERLQIPGDRAQEIQCDKARDSLLQDN